MMSVNSMARLLTWTVSYVYFFGIMSMADRLFANYSDLSDTTSRLTWLRHAALLAAGPIVASQLLDYASMSLLPQSIIPQAKTQPFEKAKSLSAVGSDQLRVLVTIATVSWALGPAGIAYWTPLFQGTVLDIAWSIQKLILEGYVIYLIKDVTSMYFVHRWMHTWPSLWWLHKYHHTVVKEMSATLGTTFGTLDLLLENASGLLFWLPLKYALTGDATMHFGAYICVVWIDHTMHFANPHMPSFLNPVLDITFRGIVNHQLHHAVINEYFTLIPFHHIWSSARQADLQRYNKIFGTEIA